MRVVDDDFHRRLQRRLAIPIEDGEAQDLWNTFASPRPGLSVGVKRRHFDL